VIGEPGGGWEAGRVRVTGEPGGKSPRGKHWQKILTLRLKVMGYDSVESGLSRTGERLRASQDEQ